MTDKPDLYRCLAIASHRRSHPSGRASSTSRRFAFRSAIAENAIPATFGFIAGLYVTVGGAYVWSFFL